MTGVDELERLSALIDLVYQGATDAGLWPDIVSAACRWLESPKGMLYTPLHRAEQGGFYFQHGLSDFFLETYKARYQAVDMWTQEAVRRDLFTEGNVLLGTDLVPQATLVQSPWYRDCLELGDISQLLTSVVFALRPASAASQPAEIPTACSFYRRSTDVDYTEQERRKLMLLVPHLSRSLGVMTRLRMADLKVASSQAALDQLPVAVLLMSASGDVLFANRAAAATLAGTDVLHIVPDATARGLGRLAARSPRVGREIACALSGARQIGDVAHFSSVIRVPARAPGPDLLINLSRVGAGTALRADGEIPEVIAFVTDPRRPLDLAPDTLVRTYGLTRAEARAAVAASRGGSVDEIASGLGVSTNTVKSHLKQVYGKTGARDRAELVRLILGSSTMG